MADRSAIDINLYKLFAERAFNLLRIRRRMRHRDSKWDLHRLGAEAAPRNAICEDASSGTCSGSKIGKRSSRAFTAALSLWSSPSRKVVELTVSRCLHAPRSRGVDSLSQCEGAAMVSIDLIRRLSPDSLSIIEFKIEREVRDRREDIGSSVVLGSDPKGWNFAAYGEELNMTRAAEYFLTRPNARRLSTKAR